MYVFYSMYVLCIWCNNYSINRLKASSSNGSSLVASSCANGCEIILDSGMPYIAGPSDEITTLQGFIGAKQDSSSGDVWDKYYCELLIPLVAVQLFSNCTVLVA